MRKRIKGKLNELFGARLLRKLESDNSFSYKDVQLDIPAGVFHPKYFSSSKLLMDWVEQNDLQGKRVIEIGCGSGISSILAAKAGAHVTAIDINASAISNLLQNASKLKVQLEAYVSDLFSEVPNQSFDHYLINPPFYPKQPESEAEHAWFCGPEFEYFKRLFQQLNEREVDGNIWMTLSNDCDLEQIQKIAVPFGYEFIETRKKRGMMEVNWLFELKRID